jgi:hypothetical protein
VPSQEKKRKMASSALASASDMADAKKLKLEELVMFFK